MNIGSKESAIRLAIGFAFIILTGLIFTPSSLVFINFSVLTRKINSPASCTQTITFRCLDLSLKAIK